MDEEESLRRFGVDPPPSALPEIRELLRVNTRREEQSEEGDLDLMRLCCVQLFNAGDLDDVLLIWAAKSSGWDANGMIDVALLCGAGLEATKAYLSADGSDDARDALRWLTECEAAGDFRDFDLVARAESFASYYGWS